MDQAAKDDNATVPPAGKDNSPMGSIPASADQNAITPSAPAMNPQGLYAAMGQLGMQAEQKQFEQDMMQLQASLAGKGDDVMNQYTELRKKGGTTSAIGAAAGAIVGGLAGLFLGRQRANWGRVTKGAVTAGGGVVGAGVASVLTGLPMRKQMAALQQQASELEASQASALQVIMDKYTIMVQERLGNKAEDKMNPELPEEPGKPILPDSLTQNKTNNLAPATLLHNASASPLVTPTHAHSVL